VLKWEGNMSNDKTVIKCSCGCGKEHTVTVGGTYEVMAFGCEESIERSRQEFLIEYGLTDD
jgi:hypothetical protein